VNLRRAYDRTLKNLLLLQQTRPDQPAPPALQNEPQPTVIASETNMLQASPSAPATPEPVSENRLPSVPLPLTVAAACVSPRMHANLWIIIFYDETLLH
jgi:hypothetical protein